MNRKAKNHQKTNRVDGVRATPDRGTQDAAGRRSSSTLRRRVLATWFVFASLLALGGAYSHFGQPISVTLGATLRSFDSLSLSYGGSSKEHISPLCGCWKEQSAESWRGVTFATRRIVLSRTGAAPLTAYVVTAPWPAKMQSGGPWMALPVKSFGPIPSSFDPNDVLKQFKQQAIGPRSPNTFVTNVQYAVLVTDQPVHVGLFGDLPLGAWIPMGASELAIVPQLAMFTSTANSVLLTESYSKIITGVPRRPRGEGKAGSVEPEGDQSNAELPALDLLGKRTVIWSESPNASVWLSETGMTTLKVGQAGSAIGLVIDPVFSARVTVIPTNREALARFAAVEQSRLLPQPQDWLGVSEAGAITLQLERTAEDLEQFDRITERLKTDDKVENVRIEYPRTGWIAATGEDFFTYEPRGMDFRYPPFPPARGFNIFGQMAHLKFEGATGNVVLGSRVADVPAPSRLEFRGIRSFRAARGVIPVAVRGANETSDATLAFSGVSEAWLNGDPLARKSDRVSWSTGFWLFIAGIVQGIAAALALATGAFAGKGAAH